MRFGIGRRFRRKTAAAILLALAGAGVAQAADPTRRTVAPPTPEATFTGCRETKESALPADVFGFGSGTDVADPGSLGAALEYNGASGRRGGSFVGHSLKTQAPYGLAPCLEIGPSLNFGSGRGTNRLALTTDRATVFGGQFEVKYKVLGRAVHGVGLTLVTEPGYSMVRNSLSDPLTPFSGSERSRQFSNTYKVLTDFTLVPDRLFGAVSFEFSHAFNTAEPLALNGCAPASGRLDAWCRSSNLNTRGALALKIADPLFIGVEASHLRAYRGAFLNVPAGHATFIGPTFFWEPIAGKLSISGTVAVQVAGKAVGVAGNLDTTNFNRHVAKLKLGYTF